MQDANLIVFVVYSLRGGGAERVVSRLSNEIAKDREVHIVLLSNEKSFYKLSPEIVIHSPDFPKPHKLKFIYFLKLGLYIRKCIKGIKPASVVSFGESINSFVLLSLMGINVKKFVSNRASPLSNMTGFRGIVNPIFYPLADKVIVQTRKAVEIMKPKYNWCKFAVLPNPIDIPDKVTPLLDREKNIINVGYLGGRKNQAELIKVFSELDNKEGWKLQLVGDGPDRAKLEEQVETLGLTKSVEFLGARKDVPELLDNARIFAFTSLTEGFPNALAEAMAAGCACISYDIITGPSELLGEGTYGELIKSGPNRTSMLKNKIECMLKNDNRQLYQYSIRARKGTERYSIQNVNESFINIIT